jgi:hypothetical protein
LIFRYGSLAPQSVPPKHGRKNFQGVNMSSSRIIDVHTHILDKDTIRPLQKEAPSVGLKLQPVDAESAVLEVAGVAYKPFPRGGFDAACRLQDMNATGIDIQVLSATPVHAAAAWRAATSPRNNPIRPAPIMASPSFLTCFFS